MSLRARRLMQNVTKVGRSAHAVPCQTPFKPLKCCNTAVLTTQPHLEAKVLHVLCMCIHQVGITRTTLLKEFISRLRSAATKERTSALGHQVYTIRYTLYYTRLLTKYSYYVENRYPGPPTKASSVARPVARTNVLIRLEAPTSSSSRMPTMCLDNAWQPKRPHWQGSYILVRPKTLKIPEAMVCRILMFMRFFGP